MCTFSIIAIVFCRECQPVSLISFFLSTENLNVPSTNIINPFLLCILYSHSAFNHHYPAVLFITIYFLSDSSFYGFSVTNQGKIYIRISCLIQLYAYQNFLSPLTPENIPLMNYHLPKNLPYVVADCWLSSPRHVQSQVQ